MIKPWVFEFNAPLGRDVPDFSDVDRIQRAFDINLARMVTYEDIGFEGIFFSEHHFVNSLNPSPNLFISAIASRTKTMKLGVMGHVLAFHEPYRVVEDLAVLDYITNGRLEIGLAVGIPPEFLFVNIPQDDVRPRYRESIEFLEQALTQATVTHEGRFWNYDDLPIMPRIKPSERRRKWMTIYSESSCRYAASVGYRVCTGMQSTKNAAKAFNGYREEADKLGIKVGPDDMAIRRRILVTETDSEANALFEELLAADRVRMASTFGPVDARLHKSLGQGVSKDVLKSGTVDAAAPKREGGGSPDFSKSTNPLEIGLVSIEDEFIYGSPATVAERIIEQCRQMGAGHILAMHHGSLTEAECNSGYDLWRKIIPILKKADIS